MIFFTAFTALLVMMTPVLVIAHPIEVNEQLGLRSEVDDRLTELFARDTGV
jgi:hypothetical protein